MNILPTPVNMHQKEGTFLLSYDAHIVLDISCTNHIYHQGVILRDLIEKTLGLKLHLTRGVARSGDIFISYHTKANMNAEYYELDVTDDGIFIQGNEQSIIYGIQSLMMILEQFGANIPKLELYDYPELTHRGFYYDITRGRMPKLATLKWLADLACRYKLNQLQLYVEHTYFFRDFSEVWYNDTPITPEEIMELDAYCYERNIELIPSLATCSHMYSLLRTNQLKHLCELDDPECVKFTARERMHHHTIDISNKESFELVKQMIIEFRALFRSDKFNICADETFDMGKGKSKSFCEEHGMGKAYVSFVKRLCELSLELGCIPMMWGDIILKYPELLADFPQETIFLNWEYHTDVTEDQTKIFADANVTFYNCPGVSSWSRFIDANCSAYKNIHKMSTYVKKYNGIGFLNTCWGDYYHTSHTMFSFLGLIYGAHFAWTKTPDSMEEIDRLISLIEFGKENDGIVPLISEIEQNTLYDFNAICSFSEDLNVIENDSVSYCQDFFGRLMNDEEIIKTNAELARIKKGLASSLASLTNEKSDLLNAYILVIDGVAIFNQIGSIISQKEYFSGAVCKSKASELAKSMEQWFHYYKNLWRSVSKEGELWRITQVIEWYGNYLRNV